MAKTMTFGVLAGVALALSACGSEKSPTYETDVQDKSGGELIVEEPNPDEVKVTLPDTPMANVPEAEASASAAPAP